LGVSDPDCEFGLQSIYPRQVHFCQIVHETGAKMRLPSYAEYLVAIGGVL